MQQHNPSKPEVLCAVCKERKAQGAIGDGIPVCGECFTEQQADPVRIWRTSLKVVVGGYPR